MVTEFSTWLFNVMLWGGIISTLALLFDRLVSPGFVASGLTAAVGAAIVAVVALIWPRF